MKRSCALILAAAILFCIGSASAVTAHGAPVTISIGSAEAKPGEEVSVSLEIHGDYTATALTLAIHYDPALLTRTGGLTQGEVWTDITSSGGMAMTNLQDPSMIVFTAITYNFDSSFSASGVLFTVRFTVSPNAQPGSSIPLMLDVRQFTFDEFDGTVIQIPFTAQNGRIDVTGGLTGLAGDVDCSGDVSYADISMLSMYLNGENPLITEQGWLNADANASGTINISDIAAIYNIIALS